MSAEPDQTKDDDPTATVQAVADVFGNLDGAFWASLTLFKQGGYSWETMVSVWQAIEDCGTFIKQQLGIPLPTELYEVRIDQTDAG